MLTLYRFEATFILITASNCLVSWPFPYDNRIPVLVDAVTGISDIRFF